MDSIESKLKSIKFGENKFRKLQKLEINFSDRITVIGGLNGIGKSTILGLIANCSGIRSSQYKSYFNALFQANFQELFHLDENDDYKEKINELNQKLLQKQLNKERRG